MKETPPSGQPENRSSIFPREIVEPHGPAIPSPTSMEASTKHAEMVRSGALSRPIQVAPNVVLPPGGLKQRRKRMSERRKLLKVQLLQREMRRKAIGRSICLIWESLGSHLNAAVKSNPKKDGGNEEFHSRTALEYAQVIYTLAQELHELALFDFKVAFESIKPNFK